VSRALAIVQARMSSTRLPGKSLADVGGEPMLALLLRRLRRASEVDRIVVATSIDSIDDPIEDMARAIGCDVHRGSRDDVLARFVGAAEGHTGPLARVTGDCPLVDPELVDETIRLFVHDRDAVYASNIEPRSYPDGLDVEVFSSELLGQLDDEVDAPHDREHVTTAVRREPQRFRSASLVCKEQLGDLRWTVDTPDDLEFLRELAARLGSRRYEAGMHEILEAVRQEPSLATFHGRRG
jgi:spore coat polysaccharide biosynthesis protein SpsF (cytidylyltransferase family)